MLHLVLATGAKYGDFQSPIIKCALYAEVGRFPLYICRYQRIIKYFLNSFTKKVNNYILNSVSVNQMQRVNNSMDLYKCFFKVRNVLQLSGFACVWLSTESVNVNILYQC